MQKNSVLAAIIIVLVIALGFVGYKYLGKSKQVAEQTREIEENKELVEMIKSEMEVQYEDLAIQYDKYLRLDIHNDSLQDELFREQQRVQDLLEELRQTKASNAQEIAKLKKELATMQTVMQDLVRQIDTLQVEKQRLTEENEQLVSSNLELTNANTELSNLNSQLSETVSRASMLEISSLNLTTLDKNNRKKSQVRNIQKLQFDFVIAKNITCEPGEKELYVRLTDPEENLLGEDEEHLFAYENAEILYTFVIPFEYSGEEYKGACYYTFEEDYEIQKGNYTITFFCDGNQIGSFPFELRKY